MSDTENNDPTDAPDETRYFEPIAGKKFDISTVEGKNQLQGFIQGLSHVTGKLSNEVGTLRKETAPFKKLGVKAETTDEAQLAIKLKSLTDEGRTDEAFGLLFNELKATRLKNERERDANQFWDEYKRSRSDLFEMLPEDVAKTYVFANYGEQLYEVEDPYALIDSILEPKVSRFKKSAPSAAPIEIPASLGAGNRAPAKPKVDSKEEAAGRAALLKAMGIK